ncbi:hypothetical protein GCM10010215_71120 [Streptomyces virginiae]|uniref:Uncharacterized protein n=1 Tax=Streptomyces virginiae TaxID=1961 RepID=A0ABQ3NYX2_STRVG|nr:hypothetical protein GCM10010215_71120 [Streptomyces virginiae]GHI17966.1 hypothetical protein Scinn_74290 [Streptomyces virginiae]
MCHPVCPVGRHPLVLRSPEQLENARPAMLRRQIRHARDDVEVNVREAFGFGEPDDAGLGAARHAPGRQSALFAGALRLVPLTGRTLIVL